MTRFAHADGPGPLRSHMLGILGVELLGERNRSVERSDWGRDGLVEPSAVSGEASVVGRRRFVGHVGGRIDRCRVAEERVVQADP